MAAHDWSRFTLRIDIAQYKDRLYRAWATQLGLESWFLRAAAFQSVDGEIRQDDDEIQAGDSYSWQWWGWPDDVVENGTILKTETNKLVKFTFGGDPQSPIVVTVLFKDEHDMQLLELTQENIPLTEEGKIKYYLGCRDGWTFYLTNLKSVFEGGIDLRNRNVMLQNVINK